MLALRCWRARVGLQFQVAHAHHRGAGAELVKKIHQLLVVGDDVDVLHLLDEESVVRVRDLAARC